MKTVPLRAATVLAASSPAFLIIALSMTPASAAADAAKGQADFVRECALCHTIGKDEPNRYGPNLFGIVGRAAASVPGYRYSPAFRSSANWVWKEDVQRLAVLARNHGAGQPDERIRGRGRPRQG